jgi:hypothetical protein
MKRNWEEVSLGERHVPKQREMKGLKSCHPPGRGTGQRGGGHLVWYTNAQRIHEVGNARWFLLIKGDFTIGPYPDLPG